jgi:hypothetical protein
MTNTITISASYTCSVAGVVDLSPKTWNDVDDWYIKWDNLHIRFKGETDWKEFDINSDTSDCIDWKRPAGADIFSGKWQFDDELASSW